MRAGHLTHSIIQSSQSASVASSWGNLGEALPASLRTSTSPLPPAWRDHSFSNSTCAGSAPPCFLPRPNSPPPPLTAPPPPPPPPPPRVRGKMNEMSGNEWPGQGGGGGGELAHAGRCGECLQVHHEQANREQVARPCRRRHQGYCNLVRSHIPRRHYHRRPHRRPRLP